MKLHQETVERLQVVQPRRQRDAVAACNSQKGCSRPEVPLFLVPLVENPRKNITG